MSRVRTALSSRAPDPEDALRRWDRIHDAARATGQDIGELSDDALTVARICCQRAPYLATLLARDPRRLDRVARDPYLRREKPRELLASELAGRLVARPVSDEDLARELRLFRADEMVRLGAREIRLGNRAEVGRELAHLAEVCFDAAIEFHDTELRRRYGPPRYHDDDEAWRDAELSVIGMGKLGGLELNFSSDVDVIYVYSSDNGSAGELSLHEYFCKLCERVSAAIGEVTSEDVVFRVDLRLRPEGSRGAIANSMMSTERYYEAWGRPWERQAWLKARPCAGDEALGEQVVTLLRPFVYPRTTSPTIIEEVANLNRRIKAELDVSGGVETGYDLKNGVGGIREIEFFVQALQLIHAGHQPGLRSRTTLVALDQLFFAGLVTEAEHHALSEAYRFLRHGEHVLQLDSGRQTQRLPSDEQAVDLFAKRLGCANADALRATLRSHTATVAQLFATLGEDDGGPQPEVIALVAAEQTPERERELLERLGFRDPARAQANLELARRKPLSPLGRAATGAAARVAPALFAEVATSPDPDQALGHVTELIGRRGSWSAVWGVFDSNPVLMRLIASLFGTSEFLSKSFVAHPELIDALLQTGRAKARSDLHELRAALGSAVRQLEPDDDEGHWDRLAEFKQAQVLRIGLADVGGEIGAEETSAELSNLAEVTLESAFQLVAGALAERHGVAREADTDKPAQLAVLALGKLGGKELGYASDLDLIFVYSADGTSDGDRPLDNVTYMTRLAQRLMGGLHALHRGGRLYEIDTRLRPSGSKGLLVSSMAAWERYHRGEARLWERQALVKLRPVAGDRDLGTRVAAAASEYVWGHAPGEAGRESAAEIGVAIMTMRAKIEAEQSSSATAIDLKTGRGGLVDIEFTAQFLQLTHGHDHPELRTQSTITALSNAAELGVADAADCTLLIDGYRFLRTLEHRMRIVHDRSVQQLPTAGHDLDLLARRAGYGDGGSLKRDCLRWRDEIRAAYQRVLGHPR